jgi:hypothetical protein
MPTTKLKVANRAHPKRARWIKDEQRMRASYIASRRELAPFLVPHRFEGNKGPTELTRAQYGYGIGLNKAYLSEIIGHIRSTKVTYQWGPLVEGGDEPEQDGTPKGGLARTLFTDATRKGVKLRDFFEGDAGVLEWMLSSPGGFVVVDAPPADSRIMNAADEKALGRRPYFRFVPWSAVEDAKLGPAGFEWVKFCEEVDTRTAGGDDTEKLTTHRLLYELTNGVTTVSRFNEEGDLVNPDGTPAGAAPTSLGEVRSVTGEAILPLIVVGYGEHPEVPMVGKGLLYGLDDIVIDLFNVVSEMREGYRDATFGLHVHKGPDADQVRAQLAAGSRLIALGDSQDASLDRVAAESGEVTAGLSQIELGVKNWALSAKRQAAEAMQSSGAEATSGVSLQAEFALDLKPLLVSIANTLDSILTNALYVAAQIAGHTSLKADEIGVNRNTDFNVEDEASRIARIAKDYVLALPLSAEMKVQLALAWVRSANIIDLEAEVEVPEIPNEEQQAQDAADAAAASADATNEDGTPRDPAIVGEIKPKARKAVKMTVGERIEQELRSITDAEQSQAVSMAAGPFASIPPGAPNDLTLPAPSRTPVTPSAASGAPSEGTPNVKADPSSAQPATQPAAQAAAPDLSPVIQAIEAVKAEVEQLSEKVDAIEPDAAPAANNTTVVLPSESPDMRVKKISDSEWLITRQQPKGA